MASETLGTEISPNLPKLTGWREKSKFIAINAFLIFHIVAIACWCIPINTPLTLEFKELVRPYFLWSGLFQAWDMFSPNPKAGNSYLEAIVIYQDGSIEMWTFPRMELLSITEKTFKERYRKFEDVLSGGEFPALWPEAARRVARLNNDHSTPPQKVMLVVRWSDIIPKDDGSYDRGPWGVEVFYSYDVTPEDLQ